ncbi:MAG: efflux RND transporter periplasmic adaptor subunit [Bryobacterales bacterium]|nr:efflux RND transporter periplasmic adaptor subunit [Bryobacterales bacterium]
MATESKSKSAKNPNGGRTILIRLFSLVGILVLIGAGYAAWRYTRPSTVDVKTAKVRRGEFLISVKNTGDIKSSRSVILSVGHIPNPAIVRLAPAGSMVHKGDVVVELDAASLEQSMLTRTTEARTVDSEMVQLKASQRIQTEANELQLMQAQYNVERAKLEASKAEIVSEIQGAKNRIDVTVSEGEQRGVETVIESAKASQNADMQRLERSKAKAQRDVERTRGYLERVKLYAPVDGIVNLLPNFRSGGFGRTPPPFKEGDRVWSGASIVEIPDLSEMYVYLTLDEVDRGRVKLGQQVRVRVDAVPDKEFQAEVTWISPIAEVIFRGFRNLEKQFPARAVLKALDERLRPGMTANAEVVVSSVPGALLIPITASFTKDGKPAVWLQHGGSFVLTTIEAGERNDTDLQVLKGISEGDVVALEDPVEAMKRAHKL